MNNRYKDCYVSLHNDTLKLGNEAIERSIVFKGNYPVSEYILNKKTGYKWFNPDGKELAIFNLPVLNFKNCIKEISSCVSNHDGLSEDFLLVCVEYTESKVTVKWQLEVFPTTPFIASKLYIKGEPLKCQVYNLGSAVMSESTGIELQKTSEIAGNLIQLPETDAVDAFPIYNKHLKLETLRFFDVTDVNDTLVKKSEELIYAHTGLTADGNAFIINAYLEEEGLIVVKDGFTVGASLNRTQDELIVKPRSCVQLRGTGLDYMKLSNEEFTPCYGSTIGVGHPEEVKGFYKRYYNQIYRGPGDGLFIMSNNWGDRNQDKSVCEEFILKEIEAAKQLGVDVVQIDDGWQKGTTANSALTKRGVWEGYYEFDSDFWMVNSKKFPRGFAPIMEAIKGTNVKIGLWFSPDSSKDMGNWEKDANVLLNFYRKFNIQFFKLDGIKIRNKKCEINLLKLMNKVSVESDNKVSFNLDITAEVRFGYFYEKQFGTIFVENRYTDWCNYYPHNTLKNLWQLSELLPTRKFQFELLNNKRNIDKYDNDMLAPCRYSMDYLFAITMFSNPLIWMEMSNLLEEDVKALKNIIQIYKKERQRIFFSEVLPIGDMPDGISFTGFQAVVNNSEGYLLLFREFTKTDSYEYKVKYVKGKQLKLNCLYTNGDNYDIKCTESGGLKVVMERPATFVFAKYEII